MASLSLTDMQTTLECIVFARAYEHLQGKLRDGQVLVIDGRLDTADGRARLLVSDVNTLEEAGSRRRSPRKATPPGRGTGSTPKREPSLEHRESKAETGSHEPTIRRVSIHIDRTDDREADLARVLAVYAAMLRFPGRDEVEILVRDGARGRSIPLPSRLVQYCEAFEQAVQGLNHDTSRAHVAVDARA